MIKKISSIDLLPYAWLLFLLGACVSPRFKELNNIFYLTILPLTLFTVRDYFSHFIRTPIYLWILAFAGWMALSSTWAIEPDYSDLKSIFYVIIFITGMALTDDKKAIEKWGILIPIAIGIQLFFSKVGGGQRLSGFGPMENPLYAGHFYVFFSWLFLNYEKFHSKSTLSTAIRWSGFLISAGACYLTQSRSAIICLPILIFMFLIQKNSLKHQKKIVLILALIFATTLTGITFGNQWVTLPNHKFDYSVNLAPEETLLVTFLGSNVPEKPPEISSSNGLTTSLPEGSNPKEYLFTAKKSDTFHLKVTLPKNTINPWRFIKLSTKKDNEPFKLKENLTPPRALQFDLSFGYRTEIWAERIKHCLEKPIFGHGFSQNLPIPFRDHYVNDSHNFFLGATFFGGAIALIIYLGLLTSCLYTLVTQKSWALLTLLICGIITTSFDDEKFFSSTRPYWLLLLFPIGKALQISLDQRLSLIARSRNKKNIRSE
ncbi:MAG: O-antigen ligase family protein [Porticoccus sp.]|nr:O-antigen ligase family protein [Porticoccus sp.]